MCECCAPTSIKKIKIDASNAEAIKKLREEKEDIRTKICNLHDFIDNTDNKLSEIEWRLLRRQLNVMQEFYEILSDRCRLYGIEDDMRIIRN